MKSELKLLSLDYNLKSISEKELAIIMMEACAVYNECQHSIPASKKDAWIRVEQVANEIIRRHDMETTRESGNATIVDCAACGINKHIHIKEDE